MCKKEDVKQLIEILHAKGYCGAYDDQDAAYAYVPFKNNGGKYTNKRSGDSWINIYNCGRLWVPTKRSKFKDVNTKKNWLCPWSFKRPSEITELMYTNFCKYFDIENEVGLNTKDVYLAEDDDTFIV